MRILHLTKQMSILLLFSLFIVSQPAHAQRHKRKHKKADEETKAWRYEIEPVGVGTEGSYIIKVWSYSKSVRVAIEQSKKNAVHGIIFKGFSNKGRIPGQKPLAHDPNLENEKADFFNNFFKQGGDYLKFVTLVNNGSIGPGDRIYLGKREFKIGVVVTVKVSALRQYLESQGIIKSLSSGF